MTFRYGSNFRTKSEESRFQKVSDQVLKLRHLLINDPANSHDYILKFLSKFYKFEQIGQFEEKSLHNFINAVIELDGLNPNISLKDFVKRSLKSKNASSRTTRGKSKNGQGSVK